jgi:hypothetical protein
MVSALYTNLCGRLSSDENPNKSIARVCGDNSERPG